jgi:hypothetical protein
MWEPRRLTIPWAFTACYRDSLASYLCIIVNIAVSYSECSCLSFDRTTGWVSVTFSVSSVKWTSKHVASAFTGFYDIVWFLLCFHFYFCFNFFLSFKHILQDQNITNVLMPAASFQVQARDMTSVMEQYLSGHLGSHDVTYCVVFTMFRAHKRSTRSRTQRDARRGDYRHVSVHGRCRCCITIRGWIGVLLLHALPAVTAHRASRFAVPARERTLRLSNRK